MIINLKDKTALIPRNEKGDPAFKWLNTDHRVAVEEIGMKQKELVESGNATTGSEVLSIFTAAEIVELVNRALYQIEYQKTSHRKRGQKLRDVEKALKEELKKQGLDVKVTEIKNQLEGKK